MDSIVGTVSKGDVTDIALMFRMKEGDMSAFEEIYYRWNRQVYSFILKITRSVSDTEDIMQDIFIRLWKMHEQIDPQKSIQSLLFTIARRIAVDMYRRNGKFAVMQQNEPVKVEADTLGVSPHEILEEQETSLMLEIAIERMPEKQRNVFTLYYRQNLSPKEIAEQLGLSYENVRKHIYNGKQQLREIIAIMTALLVWSQ